MYYLTFKELQEISSAKGENKDCTVKALAVVCDIDYEMAHYALEEAGRKPRQGCRRSIQEQAVKSLNFTWEDVTSIFYREGAKTMVTMERALRQRARGQKFLVYVDAHVAGFDGEKIIDWAKGTRRRIQQVVMVKPCQPSTAS